MAYGYIWHCHQWEAMEGGTRLTPVRAMKFNMIDNSIWIFFALLIVGGDIRSNAIDPGARDELK